MRRAGLQIVGAARAFEFCAEKILAEKAGQRGAMNPGGGGGSQQQLASVSPATIDNPVVKIAGLILGSPEFQRQ